MTENKTSWQELVRWDEIIDDYGDKWTYIDSLIDGACLSPDEKQFCENINADNLDEELEDMLVKYLLDAQPHNRIQHGMNYGQMDIQRILDKLI